MKFFYDFHIHSDLSPCGDKDMTPNNIVNMAYIKGLSIISVTDHNTAKNYTAVEKTANQLGILTIPGIEINTREEVHILSYFKDYSSAESVSDLLYESLPDIRNKPDIFGEQNIYNENDEVVGRLDKLLISASKYSLEEIYAIVSKYNGVVVPAHVNKKSSGILGVLGFFPDDIKFEFIELANGIELSDRNKKIVANYKRIVSSDAHILENISEPVNYVDLEKIEDIFSYLNIKC